MKTDNIYIAELGYSSKTNYGSGIYTQANYRPIKYIIVKKHKDKSGESIAIDLKSKKKYLCKVPLERGVLFVPPANMIHFELVYPDVPRNLSKRKILKMANDAIDKIKKRDLQ